jgi:c-di-AMP phosphodiesterase-like protein
MRFEPKFDLGTVITALLFMGTLIGVYRTMEVRGIELKKDQEAIVQRMESYEATQARLVERMEAMAIIQTKTITILDEHLKNYKP